MRVLKHQDVEPIIKSKNVTTQAHEGIETVYHMALSAKVPVPGKKV